MNKDRCKILLFFISAILLLSQNIIFAQSYNESDREVLRKFGRKASGVAGKLDIDRMWRAGVPVRTSTWYSNEAWITNLLGITWDNQFPTHITRIDWSSCQVPKFADSIDLTGADYIDYFRCFSNEITGVNVKNNPTLTTIYCGYNKIKYLDVTHNPNFTMLDFCHNEIDEIDVSHNTSVTCLCAQYNRLKELDLTGFNSIRSIWLNNNKLNFPHYTLERAII